MRLVRSAICSVTTLPMFFFIDFFKLDLIDMFVDVRLATCNILCANDADNFF